nr:glutamate-cysteine ligase [Micrococcus sp.]
MGAEVESATYTRSERTRYRERLESSLDELKEYLADGELSDTGRIGLELELNLVGDDQLAAPVNEQVLAAIDDPAFQTELGRFTIELNHPALTIRGTGLTELEASLRAQLERAEERAVRAGASILPVGILPTLRGEDLSGEGWISEGNRYAALNTAVLESRGEEILIDIDGPEHLAYYAQDIAAESACTSMQLHLEVTRERFGPVWNASQAMAGPQLALAANSPLFLGSLLWDESRIAVFQQAIDTRSPELARQGVRPRVWFGERWVDGIEDLFEENVAFFPSLLPEAFDVPRQTAAGAPTLPELMLHNGTVYRWNRPIFDPGKDAESTPSGESAARPANIRVENRILPAGPTFTDMVANAAFYFGLVRHLVDGDERPWERMAFSTAQESFYACAQDGLRAEVYWPGFGQIPVTELLDRHLLPSARRGLEMLEVDPAVIDRYMDVLTGRTRNGQTGAVWMSRTLKALEEGGMPRAEALAELVARYRRNVATHEPVHTWPVEGVNSGSVHHGGALLPRG